MIDGYDLQLGQSTYPLLFDLTAEDGFTPLAGGAPTVLLSKAGAAFGAPAGAVTEIANGVYQVAANAVDCNALGPLMAYVTCAGGLPRKFSYRIVAYNPFDAAALGLTNLNATITSRAVAGDAMTLQAASIAAATFAAGAINAAAIAADAIDADALATDAIAEIHNLGCLSYGTGQVGSTVDYMILAAAEAHPDDYYNGCLLEIVSGAAAGQSRLIADYIGVSDIAVASKPFTVAPDGTSVYRIRGFSGILLADTGVAIAAAADTITLSASASAIADTYVGHTIYITGGVGAGQARLITGYTAGRVATVSPAWTTALDVFPSATTSIYKVLPIGRTYVNEIDATVTADIADGVWDEPMAGHIGVGTTGKALLDILAVESGKWEITKGTNRLVLYEADGMTPLYTFDLVDNALVSSRTRV